MPFHTNSSGVDVDAFRRAAKTAAEAANAAGVDVIFLVPTLKNVDSDAFVEVFGEKQATAFKRNREMMVNGVRFHLETALKKRASGSAIVLAIYLSISMLNKAIEDQRTIDWVFLPWSENELKIYVSAYPSSKVV